jgi:hypothetical protein
VSEAAVLSVEIAASDHPENHPKNHPKTVPKILVQNGTEFFGTKFDSNPASKMRSIKHLFVHPGCSPQQSKRACQASRIIDLDQAF